MRQCLKLLFCFVFMRLHKKFNEESWGENSLMIIESETLEIPKLVLSTFQVWRAQVYNIPLLLNLHLIREKPGNIVLLANPKGLQASPTSIFTFLPSLMFSMSFTLWSRVIKYQLRYSRNFGWNSISNSWTIESFKHFPNSPLKYLKRKSSFAHL